jgi:hypothetical protein
MDINVSLSKKGEEKYLNFAKDKTATLIALFLIFAMAFSLVALPAANAHDPPWDIYTWAYMDVSPKTTGVNQEVLIIMWLDKLPMTANGAYGDRYHGFTVDITEPNGDTQTLGPFTSDPVGSAVTNYTPDQVGTYTFVFKFPGDTITGEPSNPDYLTGTEYINDTIAPSTSDPVYLTVQEEPIQDWTETPLPTEYWTRPINGINRQWYQIADNWLGNGNPANSVSEYSTGPESAHIMWTREYTLGGVGDGEYGDISYYSGKSYQTMLPNPVIINGKFYYNEYANRRYPIDGDPPAYGFYAVDLRTGETLWWKNDTVSFGQILDDETPNEHGERAYLWKIPGLAYGAEGNVWFMYDPFNGNDLIKLTNIPSGTTARDKIGSMLRYQLDTNHDRLLLWNSTKAILYPSTQAGHNYYWDYRTPQGYTVDARDGGYEWNVSIPADLQGGINIVLDDRLIGSSGMVSLGWGTSSTASVWALSLKPGQEGTLLWKHDVNPSANNETWGLEAASLEDGVYIMSNKEARTFYGYSLDTGKLMWGPTEAGNQWDMYSTNCVIAYNKLYTYGYGGVLRAYDVKTGDFLWNYTAPAIGHEIAYPNYPLSLGAVADGKIYLYSTEHSPSKPLWRGSMIRCVNATDGTEIWKIEHWGNSPALADGYLVDLNLYDNRIYCYGKGPSATSVMASPKVSINGDSVLVEGTVADVCAGAKQLVQDGLQNIVPAMSDASMTAWMEYLYMQQPMPTDAEGVSVTLSTLDPNGNFYEIGNTTSDANGMYSYAFTPEVPGVYTIFAMFEGSKSYYGSSAETAINVQEMPQASPTPTPPAPSMADIYFLPAIIGMTIAIIAVGLVIILMLRKR